MTIGSSLAATCAQLEASVVEQPAVVGFWPGTRGFWTGGSCALAANSDTAKQTIQKMVHERRSVRYRNGDRVRRRSPLAGRALARPQPRREPPLPDTSCCFIHFAPLEDDYSGKPTVNGCGLECHGELHSPLKIQTVVPSFLPCPVQKQLKTKDSNRLWNQLLSGKPREVAASQVSAKRRIDDAVGDPCDLDHFGCLVHADDVRAMQDGSGNGRGGAPDAVLDRKSTRLNSSHGYISYAVFCLKKKKKKTHSVSASAIMLLQD